MLFPWGCIFGAIPCDSRSIMLNTARNVTFSCRKYRPNDDIIVPRCYFPLHLHKSKIIQIATRWDSNLSIQIESTHNSHTERSSRRYNNEEVDISREKNINSPIAVMYYPSAHNLLHIKKIFEPSKYATVFCLTNSGNKSELQGHGRVRCLLVITWSKNLLSMQNLSGESLLRIGHWKFE